MQCFIFYPFEYFHLRFLIMKYIISLTLLKSNPGFVLEGYCISYCKDLPFHREKTSVIKGQMGASNNKIVDRHWWRVKVADLCPSLSSFSYARALTISI